MDLQQLRGPRPVLSESHTVMVQKVMVQKQCLSASKELPVKEVHVPPSKSGLEDNELRLNRFLTGPVILDTK